MSDDQKTAIQSLREQLREQRQTPNSEPGPEKGFTRLTFEEIDRNFSALTVLSQRRLDDKTKSEKKVRLIIQRHYAEGHKLFKDLHHLIIKNHPLPEGWEDDETIPIVIAERRQHLFEDLKRDTFDIPTVPEHLLLTPDDMPVTSIKGELGHQNRFGVADIKVKLGALYSEEDSDE